VSSPKPNCAVHGEKERKRKASQSKADERQSITKYIFEKRHYTCAAI
jgi:23S rRNA maturation-related 3'-5' exoribonuclease YhaM